MGSYTIAGASGTPSVTAATAGIIKMENPGSATMVRSVLTRFSISPHANAADNNYAIQLKRQTTAGTWTTQAPAAKDPNLGSAVTLGAIASTGAGSASTVLGKWGFNHRAGFTYVAAGLEEGFTLPATFSNGIILEYIFAQGTDAMDAVFEFDE